MGRVGLEPTTTGYVLMTKTVEGLLVSGICAARTNTPQARASGEVPGQPVPSFVHAARGQREVIIVRVLA